MRWKTWKKTAPNCLAGDLACYQVADSGLGLSFTHAFSIAEEYVTLRVTDLSGAFRERKVRLKYPVVDTGNNTSTGLAAAALTLNGKIGFILGSGVEDTSVTAIIKSAGTTALRVDSVRTGRDDQKWLGFKISWVAGNPGVPMTVGSKGSTAGNAIKPGDSVLIDPIVNSNLDITFNFTSKELAGDSILSDTLFLFTNDFANPVLRIPFRLKYDDLPRIRVGVPGSKPLGAPGGFDAAGLPAYMPARSRISFGFTETVKVTDTNSIRIYSYLDSLKNPTGYHPIKGSFEYIRKGAGSPKASARAKAAAAGNLLADTLVFTPDYDRASDSLKVKPAPGFFIYRDIIHIGIRNRIMDTRGQQPRFAAQPLPAGLGASIRFSRPASIPEFSGREDRARRRPIRMGSGGCHPHPLQPEAGSKAARRQGYPDPAQPEFGAGGFQPLPERLPRFTGPAAATTCNPWPWRTGTPPWSSRPGRASRRWIRSP